MLTCRVFMWLSQDFGVTCVFTFMWLVSSAAWAKGLSDVKTATDPDEVLTMIDACDVEGNRCREVHDPVMSGLNTSVVSRKIRFHIPIRFGLVLGQSCLLFKERGLEAIMTQSSSFLCTLCQHSLQCSIFELPMNLLFPILRSTSQAFGFLNLILWGGNLWFVFKETGIIAPFMRPPPAQEKQPAPESFGQQAGYEQDPYAGSQGGYQPDYSQQQGGYNQEPDYTQQGAPTSFSNQM